MERIWNVFAAVLGFTFGCNFSRRPHSRFYLLTNDTPEEFITGDQPVINMLAVGLPEGQDVEEAEFYYPVSPRLGILVSEKSNQPEASKISVSKEQVEEYNRAIVETSDAQIYGSSEEILAKYMDSP